MKRDSEGIEYGEFDMFDGVSDEQFVEASQEIEYFNELNILDEVSKF